MPGDWEALKKYNLTELYKQASSANDAATVNEEDVRELLVEAEASADT